VNRQRNSLTAYQSDTAAGRQEFSVIVAGWDTDFRGEPFCPMPVLMAKAERVDKFQAICMVRENPQAVRSLVNGNLQI
jgi:thymidine kinase